MPDTVTRRQLLTTTPVNLYVREEAADAAPSRVIAGYAILFNTPSEALYEDEKTVVREEIAPEALTRQFLDGEDIVFTLFHDRWLVLARSVKGNGTLRYDVDATGVSFEFEAPRTVDGDKALELVRRGELSGCSFAFSTYYNDKNYVSRTKSELPDGRTLITNRVERMTGVYDMSIVLTPAYADTSVALRALVGAECEPTAEPTPDYRPAVRQMRSAANKRII